MITIIIITYIERPANLTCGPLLRYKLRACIYRHGQSPTPWLSHLSLPLRYVCTSSGCTRSMPTAAVKPWMWVVWPTCPISPAAPTDRLAEGCDCCQPGLARIQTPVSFWLAKVAIRTCFALHSEKQVGFNV